MLKVVHIKREDKVPDEVKQLAEFLLPKWKARDRERVRKKYPNVEFEDDEPQKTA